MYLKMTGMDGGREEREGERREGERERMRERERETRTRQREREREGRDGGSRHVSKTSIKGHLF